MNPDIIYYEEKALDYPLGKKLLKQFKNKEWVKIDSHNNIPELRNKENSEFPNLKKHLIIGIRKTHKYVPNKKVSDFLVPYTSSGCSAMCIYCYLVCNYNKCSYLRLFVNREQMLEKLIKNANQSSTELTYEIGSNSDLVLENTITNNLEWTIENFGKNERGFITFPTKFDMIEPLLNLNHKGRTIVRVSLNPEEIIKKVEFGTSNLINRLNAINKLCDAGYKIGILIAPVIFLENWKIIYDKLIKTMSEILSKKVKNEVFFEIIFMTYSYVQNAINTEAFPNAINLYDKEKMTGRGRGKYCYKQNLREQGEFFFKANLAKYFPNSKILYFA